MTKTSIFMKKIITFFSIILIGTPSLSAENYLTQAIINVKNNCIGISTELDDLKKMAGINTAVSGIGTVTAGGALATGIIKSKKDSEIESYEESLKKLSSIKTDDKGLDYINLSKEDIEKSIQQNKEKINENSIKELQEKKDELEEKSEKLGNIRTGLMAGDTAINIAGAVISGKNKIKGDLNNQITGCIQSVKVLSRAKQQARIEGTITQEETLNIDKIIDACNEWEYLDISKINNKASGAMTSNIIGATSGFIGTITSATANTKKIRQDDTSEGKEKEKHLNTASNVLAGTSGGASLVSTILSATQINAINKASEIAQKCEETLK